MVTLFKVRLTISYSGRLSADELTTELVLGKLHVGVSVLVWFSQICLIRPFPVLEFSHALLKASREESA